MTNYQFWRKIDKITRRPENMRTTRDLIDALLDGYEQGNDILIYGLEKVEDGEEYVYPLPITIEWRKGESPKTTMQTFLFFTDQENVKNIYQLDDLNKSIPVISMLRPKCVEVNLENLLEGIIFSDDESIANVPYITFNLDSPNVYILDMETLTKAFISRGFYDVFNRY